MLKRFYSIFYILIIIFGLNSCKEKQASITPSKLAINTTAYRFDELLTQENPITDNNISQVRQQHPAFIAAFNQTILNASKGEFLTDINRYKTYFDTIGINTKIKTQYKTIAPIQKGLEQMQQRLLSSEKNYQPMKLITINSGFNYKNFLLDDAVVVGLEMYLNDVDYESISQNFPSYIVHTFHKDFILPDIAQSILTDRYPDKAEYNSLLDKMLYQGKLLEYKQQLLPNAKPHTIIGMTLEEYEWCENNERDIYRFLVSENLLYDINYGNFKTYINVGPYSAGMPEGAPANTGSYIGWKMINAYQKQTSQPIQDIMNKQNSQAILNTAKYKP